MSNRIVRFRKKTDASQVQYRKLNDSVFLVNGELADPTAVGTLTTQAAYDGASAEACELPPVPTVPTADQQTGEHYPSIRGIRIVRDTNNAYASMLYANTLPALTVVEFLLFRLTGGYTPMNSRTYYVASNDDFKQQQTLKSLPSGNYQLYYRPKGTSLYRLFAFTLADSSTQADYINPATSGTPKPTWGSLPIVTSVAGTSGSLASINNVTFSAGQALDHLELVGAPDWYTLSKVSSTQWNLAWVIPANHGTSTESVKIRAFQTDTQSSDTIFTHKITAKEGALLQGRIEAETASRPLFRLAPGFEGSRRVRMKLEGNGAGWTNTGWTDFEPFGTGVRDDLGNVDWQYRNRSYTILPSGNWVATFLVGEENATDAILEYASFTWPLGNSGFNLEISETKPALPEVISTKVLKLSPEGAITAGNTAVMKLYSHVEGNANDTPISGAEYGASNKAPDTAIDSASGGITPALSSATYVLHAWAKINGAIVANLDVSIQAKAASPIAVLKAGYSYQHNNPPTVQTNLYLFVQSNGGSGTLKWAHQIIGPSADYIQDKTPYDTFTAGSFGNDYNLRASNAAIPPGAIVKIFILNVETGVEISFQLPQFPFNGDASQQNVYTADSSGGGGGGGDTPPPISDNSDQAGEESHGVFS